MSTMSPILGRQHPTHFVQLTINERPKVRHVTLGFLFVTNGGIGGGAAGAVSEEGPLQGYVWGRPATTALFNNPKNPLAFWERTLGGLSPCHGFRERLEGHRVLLEPPFLVFLANVLPTQHACFSSLNLIFSPPLRRSCASASWWCLGAPQRQDVFFFWSSKDRERVESGGFVGGLVSVKPRFGKTPFCASGRMRGRCFFSKTFRYGDGAFGSLPAENGFFFGRVAAFAPEKCALAGQLWHFRRLLRPVVSPLRPRGRNGFCVIDGLPAVRCD